MCLLWLLLQFVVLAMYWDVPPIGSVGEEEVMLEMKRERGEQEEEEAPLMGSDEEPASTYSTYSAVSCGRPDTLEAAEESPVCGSPAQSDLFRNFSVSRGEAEGQR